MKGQNRNQKPDSIAHLLGITLQNLNLESNLKRHSVWNHWDQIVGKTIAEKAWPSRIQDSTLVVKVISPSWMNELSFMKKQIVEKIKKQIQDCPIDQIRFELGTKKYTDEEKK